MTLTSDVEARSVSTMTTNENDYRITEIIAGLIEWEAETPKEGYTPQEATKIYVQAVLDDGYISDFDDTPVWELVELLGYHRDVMDPFEVHERIASLIDNA